MAQKVTKALNLDVKSQRKFIEFYETEIRKTSKDARIFHAFDRGDYFSIHGDDISIALKSSLKSSIIIKKMEPENGQELAYCSLNKNLMERLIRELLLVHFYRVEVYSNKKGGDKDEYVKAYKGSPGNLVQFENLLSNSSSGEVFSNLLVAIQLVSNSQQKKIAISCIDSDEHTISLSEFDDSDFFMELEASMVILGPKEVLLPSITGEYSKIKDLMDRNSILVSLMKKSEFQKSPEFLQDLEKIYRFRKGQQHNIHTVQEVKEFGLAMGCVAASIKYLEMIQDETNLGKYSIKVLNLNRFVHMDTAALKALNLFPSPGSVYSSTTSKTQSVLGVLDNCKTNQGKKLLRTWLKQPLKNIEMIKERLDILECFVQNQEARMVLHKDYINTMPDVLLLSNKLTRKRAQLIDVFKIYQVICRLPEMVRILKQLECNAINATIISPLKDLSKDLKKIQDMFTEIIDFDSLKKGEFLVRASFDDELNDIKENMDKIEEKIAKETASAAKTLGLNEGQSLKLDYVSHLGYFFGTSKKEDDSIRKHKKFSIIDTARGRLRFTTDNLKDLNEEYAVLKGSYEEQQKNIVAEVCRIVSGYSTPLTNLNHIIALIDLYLGLANVVYNSPGSYVRPEIFPEDQRILEISELRHPCLECQENVEYIPNDINLKADDSEFLVITGANISGKSTYIRSIGIAVLLAHIGMYVPCESAKISICDSILARIGATDDIQKNLSTFAMEMVETSSILKTATKNSLVIIDELGRGTSTFEGLGLAWSISEYLAKSTKCFTLFATHFHEITNLSESLQNVKNYHLASIVENNKLTLLFKVKPGPMTKSFGIQVAEIAQLPQSVISSAKKYLNEIECAELLNENNIDAEKSRKIDQLFENLQQDKSFDIKSFLML